MVKDSRPKASLFEHSADQDLLNVKPLAARMRPQSFEEFSGQEKILGPGTVLLRAIQADALPSFVPLKLLKMIPSSGSCSIFRMFI